MASNTERIFIILKKKKHKDCYFGFSQESIFKGWYCLGKETEIQNFTSLVLNFPQISSSF